MKTQSNLKILLAEGDPNFGPFLQAYLNAKGYPCFLVRDGDEALDAFLTDEYNFCIANVMMPQKDGFTLVKQIRRRNQSVPILFTSAQNEEDDRLRGFQVGADDFISKPFSVDELLCRIQAIIRRVEITRQEDLFVFSIGRLTFDYNLQIVLTPNRQFRLTPRESDLLRLLCQYQNEVVQRNSALTKIWGENTFYNARCMDVYVTKLRKFLRDDPDIELQNIHGRGFKLFVPPRKKRGVNSNPMTILRDRKQRAD